MGMNRRNVLIGLGAITVGGGAALGSGAFSQVSAARTVSLQTAGDGAGFLQLEGDDEYITDDSGPDSVLSIDLGQVSSTDGDGFNQEAETVVNDVVTVTNSAADDEEITVGFEDESGNQVPSQTLNIGDGDGTGVATVELFFGSQDSPSTQTVSDDGTATLGVVVDTVNKGDASDGANADATILAQDSGA